MIKVFKGIVELGDSCRCDYDGINGAILINGIDLVSEIGEYFENKVTIGIMEETFEGDLFIEEGWGYSEWTRMDSDELKVGDHDIIEILKRYENQNVKVVVSDEKVNILDL